MLDIKFIRENKELVEKGARDKGVSIDLEKLLEVDEKRRKLLQEVENLRAQRNKIAQEKNIEKGKELKEKIRKIENELEKINEKFHDLMLQVPNPAAKDVPVGKTEDENVEVRSWGKPPKFDFAPKNYITLMGYLDLLDLERGAKIGGFRQYVIKNEAVLLEQALIKLSIDQLTKKGFTPLRPTVMVKESAMVGSGMFPKGKEDTYQTDDGYLAGTTEVPLMAYHADEILAEEDLPKKYVGLSEAFRKEVGSYGKDVKGIFRIHEFWQTEQVVICKNDEKESIKWHEELLKNSEEFVQSLNLPYRVVNCCTGDLSDGQVKRYDIEMWVPSQGKYRETHSDSYLFDFQTRRLNTRYKTKNGEIKFAHSLNNTGVAVPRILIPLVENYQLADGSVKVPDVLQKFVGIERIVPKRNL